MRWSGTERWNNMLCVMRTCNPVGVYKNSYNQHRTGRADNESLRMNKKTNGEEKKHRTSKFFLFCTMHSDILIIFKWVNRKKKSFFFSRRICLHSSAESQTPQNEQCSCCNKREKKTTRKYYSYAHCTHWNRAGLGLGSKLTCDLAVWNTRCDKNNVKMARFVSLVKRHIKIVGIGIVNDKNTFVNVDGNA